MQHGIKEYVKFPQYRAYINGGSYFKIFSESEFEQVVELGRKYTLEHYRAATYPTRTYIADLIACEGKRWVEITQEQYEEVRRLVS